MAGMRQVTLCRDTHQALRAAGERNYQTILVADENAPINGLELLVRMRSNSLLKGATVILLCKVANSAKLKRLRIIDPKAQMIVRPFSAVELVQRISLKSTSPKKITGDESPPKDDEDSFLL
ncbi:hypothetical protein [Roseovarius sp.]|uniref:hypothetical protein n=1 Tax=Roseovarius sp. TaxID=1486281 RepID=UPI003A96B6A3